jgi:hypothetical protein
MDWVLLASKPRRTEPELQLRRVQLERRVAASEVLHALGFAKDAVGVKFLSPQLAS